MKPSNWPPLRLQTEKVILMRKAGTSTIVLAALLATGCVNAPRLAHGQAAAPSMQWIKLPMDCKIKRDPDIERFMKKHYILPVDEKGNMSYCTGKISTPALAADNIAFVNVVWAGQIPDNCSQSGCPVLFMTEDKAGKIADASQQDTEISSGTSSFDYAFSKNRIAVAFDVISPCSFPGSNCAQSNESPERNDKAMYIYNAKSRVFE